MIRRGMDELPRTRTKAGLDAKSRLRREDPHAWADYVEAQLASLRRHLTIVYVICFVMAWRLLTELLAFLDHPY